MIILQTVIFEMSDSKVLQCMNQIKNLPLKDVNKLDEILQKYCTIETKPLQELPGLQYTNEELIQDKFIPSPDLVAEYKTNCAKTTLSKPQLQNSKVKSEYGQRQVKRNTMNLTNRKSHFQHTGVFIQEKQQFILQNLKDKNIEATLPKMEQSLIRHQISNLYKKNIKMQNQEDEKKVDPIAEWKKARQKIMKSYQKG